MSYNTRTRQPCQSGTDRGRAFGKNMPNLFAQFMTFVACMYNNPHLLFNTNSSIKNVAFLKCCSSVFTFNPEWHTNIDLTENQVFLSDCPTVS